MSQATRSDTQKNWQAEATDVNHYAVQREIPRFYTLACRKVQTPTASVFDGAETMHAQSFPKFVGTYVHTITCAHFAECMA